MAAPRCPNTDPSPLDELRRQVAADADVLVAFLLQRPEAWGGNTVDRLPAERHGRATRARRRPC